MIEKQWNFSSLSTTSRLAAGFTLLISEVLGIVGNTFVLIIIVRILKHRKSIPNLLIFILAIVDLITLPLTYTQAIISHLGGGYYLGGQTSCDLHSTAITFCKYMAMLVISFISLDRFIAMSYPFCYKDHLLYDDTRKYRLLTVLLPLTLVFAVLSTLPLLGMSRNVLQYPGSYCLFDVTHTTTTSATLIGVHISFLGMFLVVIVASNIGVCLQAHRLIQKIKPSLRVSKREAKLSKDSQNLCENGKTSKRRKRLNPKQEKKLLRTSILATSVFLLCWLPFLIRMCLAIGGVSFSEGLDFASARLVSLQSVLDPWMYPITRRQYRSGFEFLFHKIIHVCSCGIIKGPTTTLDEIIDARANRKEALRYYRERKQSQMSKVEEATPAEKIELTDTASHTKDSYYDYKPRETSVTFHLEEENGNFDGKDQDETRQ